jgi:hypothetical protein
LEGCFKAFLAQCPSARNGPVGQTFLVLEASASGSFVRESYWEPGDEPPSRPPPYPLGHGGWAIYGPTRSGPGPNSDDYFHATIPALKVPLRTATGLADVEAALRDALAASIAHAVREGENELAGIGLPLTGWALPDNADARPIGDRSVPGEGFSTDDRAIFRQIVEGATP